MSPAQIDRYAQERQITVVSNLYEKPLGEAMQQALRITAELGMPPGYQAVQLGQARLMALVLAGMTLNIYAIMGMFLLIGVVKKNAILQVDYTNVLRGRGLSRLE